jgi:hypothetical protein
VLEHDRSGLVHPGERRVGPFLNFNDGTLCAASGIIRMVSCSRRRVSASYRAADAGADPHRRCAGAVGGSPTPETKHYQCWYRDITPGFCNTRGHNMSNGLAIVWAP